MLQSEAIVQTSEASRLLFKLCKHFARKIDVQFDERQAQACFPWGACHMQATAEDLVFRCQASSADTLQQLQTVLQAHLELLTRKAPLTCCWSQPLDLS